MRAELAAVADGLARSPPITQVECDRRQLKLFAPEWTGRRAICRSLKDERVGLRTIVKFHTSLASGLEVTAKSKGICPYSGFLQECQRRRCLID